MSRSDATAPIVLVHGAWHGAWCWNRVTPLLDAAGVPWVAAELPSCATPEAHTGLPDDVLVVERLLEDLPGTEPAVLVGHSRGGLVISEAGAHERVGHIVYLCAFLLEPDSSPASMLEETVMPAIDFGDDLVSWLKPGMAEQLFFNDCSPEDTQWAVSQVSSMFAGGASIDPPRRAWAAKTTTYIVCDLDAALAPHYQHEMASLADNVVAWDTGHSPFVNRPDLVADYLIKLSRAGG
jgi:pimeloyl-ACP methyl ester carboxylesterase